MINEKTNLTKSESNSQESNEEPKSLNNNINMNQDKQPNNKEKNSVDVNAENKVINSIFQFFSMFGIIGFFWCFNQYLNYWEQWKKYAPENYEYPSLKDFVYIAYTFVFILFLKYVIEKISGPFLKSLLHSKYKETEEVQAIYMKQMKTSFFKLIWYSTIVAIGYHVIKDLEWFPKEIFGNGDLVSYYQKGTPYIIFYDRTALFKLYYLASLGFTVSDFFFLLFIHEKRSDFHLMILHHIFTINLVSFSYLTNNSNFGIIVFFLHDITDIWVYLTRIVINTFLPDIVKYLHCAAFLGVFIYFRIYVLFKLILIMYFDLKEWCIFLYVLWPMLCVLFLMHIYWTYSIIKRFFYKKIEDVGKVNKLSSIKKK